MLERSWKWSPCLEFWILYQRFGGQVDVFFGHLLAEIFGAISLCSFWKGRLKENNLSAVTGRGVDRIYIYIYIYTQGLWHFTLLITNYSSEMFRGWISNNLFWGHLLVQWVLDPIHIITCGCIMLYPIDRIPIKSDEYYVIVHAGWGPQSIAFSCRTKKMQQFLWFMVDFYHDITIVPFWGYISWFFLSNKHDILWPLWPGTGWPLKPPQSWRCPVDPPVVASERKWDWGIPSGKHTKNYWKWP